MESQKSSLSSVQGTRTSKALRRKEERIGQKKLDGGNRRRVYALIYSLERKVERWKAVGSMWTRVAFIPVIFINRRWAGNHAITSEWSWEGRWSRWWCKQENGGTKKCYIFDKIFLTVQEAFSVEMGNRPSALYHSVSLWWPFWQGGCWEPIHVCRECGITMNATERHWRL